MLDYSVFYYYYLLATAYLKARITSKASADINYNHKYTAKYKHVNMYYTHETYIYT